MTSSNSGSKQPVGVIGLGIIGMRVVHRLHEAGHPVYVYNRSPKPVTNFLGSPAAVAEQAKVIQIFVRDSPDLVEVSQLLKGGLSPDHIVINHATVSAQAVTEAARIVGQAGAHFVNAPFMGSRDASEKGLLTYYIGGTDADIEKVAPVLQASSQKLIPVGTIEHAAVMKIASNLLVAISYEGFLEGLGLVVRSGIEMSVYTEALKQTGLSTRVIEMKTANLEANDFEPHFTTKNLLKDVGLGLELAETVGGRTPVLERVRAVLQEAVEAGYGQEDFAAVGKLFLISHG